MTQQLLVGCVQVPDISAAKDLGVIGYLLVVTVLTGMALTCWMVRTLVHSLSKSHDKTADAVERMATAQESEIALLERVSSETTRSANAAERSATLAAEQVQIAHEWQRDGVRRGDLRGT